MKKDRLVYFLIGALWVAVGLISKLVYRPYSYAHGIEDFGLADSLPSLCYVAGFSLLMSINRQFRVGFVIVAVTAASVLFEVYQFFKYQEFDLSDGLFSLVGGMLAFIIYFVFKK